MGETTEEVIRRYVKKCASSVFGVAEDGICDAQSLIDDLGGDSLDIVDFVMTVEDVFSVTIDEEASERMSTIGDFVKFLEEKNSRGELMIDASGLDRGWYE